VNNNSIDKVFKYTLSGQLLGSWTLTGGVTNPTGITLDPSNPSDVWIVDATADKVLQYTAAANRTGGSQSAAAVFSLAAGNSNPQGIADPPPPAAMAATTTRAETANVETSDAAPVTTTGSRSAKMMAWDAVPAPASHNRLGMRRSDDTPPVLHDRPAVSAGPSSRTFASHSPRSISAAMEWDERDGDESILVSLLPASDAVFADAPGLGHMLDGNRL
jgi:hypothetical protein